MKHLPLIIVGFLLGMGSSVFASSILPSGSIPFGNGGTDWSFLAASPGQVLSIDAISGLPSWIIPSALSILLPKGNFIIGSDLGLQTATTTIFLTSTGMLGVGTTTSTAKLSVVNKPMGNGTVATTTVQIGNAATTTSKSSIQLNNTAGAPQCVFLVGTVLTVSAGACK